LKIAIDDIPKGISDFELTCEAKELDLESEIIRFTGIVTIKLDLFRQDDTVYIKARSSVAVEAECARCLCPIHWILEAASENQYRPLPKIEQHILNDIGIKYYSEGDIDLSEDIHENFLLELPVKVLCSEDCKGLCPHCGQDLNKEKCDCNLEVEGTQTSKFADLIKMLEINGNLEV